MDWNFPLGPPLPVLHRFSVHFLLYSLAAPCRSYSGTGDGGCYFHRKFVVCFSSLSLFPSEEEGKHTLSLKVFLHMEFLCHPSLGYLFLLCDTPLALGTQQIPIFFSPSLTRSLTLSFSVPEMVTTVPLHSDIVTVLGKSHHSLPQLKLGNWNRGESPEADSFPGFLGSPARPSTSLFPSVEWGCPFLPVWGS